jgi:hypothetical protein
MVKQRKHLLQSPWEKKREPAAPAKDARPRGRFSSQGWFFKAVQFKPTSLTRMKTMIPAQGNPRARIHQGVLGLMSLPAPVNPDREGGISEVGKPLFPVPRQDFSGGMEILVIRNQPVENHMPAIAQGNFSLLKAAHAPEKRKERYAKETQDRNGP